jgi:hypothetical protein
MKSVLLARKECSTGLAKVVWTGSAGAAKRPQQLDDLLRVPPQLPVRVR